MRRMKGTHSLFHLRFDFLFFVCIVGREGLQGIEEMTQNSHLIRIIIPFRATQFCNHSVNRSTLHKEQSHPLPYQFLFAFYILLIHQ